MTYELLKQAIAQKLLEKEAAGVARELGRSVIEEGTRQGGIRGAAKKLQGKFINSRLGRAISAKGYKSMRRRGPHGKHQARTSHKTMKLVNKYRKTGDLAVFDEIFK